MSRARVLVAGVVLLLSAALPASAQVPPEGDAAIRTTSFDLLDVFSGGQSVRCPAGTRATGGGIAPVSTGLMTAELQLNGPLDDSETTAGTADGDVASLWYAYIRNFVEPVGTLKTFAICSAGSDAVVEATNTFTVAGDANGLDRARCPDGTRVVGGGVGTTTETLRPRTGCATS